MDYEAAGICSHQLVNHTTILGTIEFYQKVFAYLDPYVTCAEGTF